MIQDVLYIYIKGKNNPKQYLLFENILSTNLQLNKIHSLAIWDVTFIGSGSGGILEEQIFRETGEGLQERHQSIPKYLLKISLRCQEDSRCVIYIR